MAEEDPIETEPAEPLPERQRAIPRWAWIVLVVVLVPLAVAWFARERIADRFLASELERRGIRATYEVERIGPGGQVLRNVVIGDPARPDATVERMEVRLAGRLGLPGIGRITLVRPRLYGTWKDGRVSFGALDPLIYTGSKQPPKLPALDLLLVDGRARIDSPWGVAGIKAEGAGNLASGFKGAVAALVPQLAMAGCTAGRTSLYGKVTTSAGRPRIEGPVRMAGLACPAQAVTLAAATLALDTRLDADFSGGEGGFDLAALRLGYGSSTAAAARGKGRFSLRKGALTADYRLGGAGLANGEARFGRLGLAGTIRTARNFARIEAEGGVAARDLAVGDNLDGALAGLERSGAGTLAAPIVGQIRAALRREAQGSRLTGRFHARSGAEGWSVVVPQAALLGGSGYPLATLSRLNVDGGKTRLPVISGNVMTGGPGIPRITGRMERSSRGGLFARLAMADYTAGGATLGIPRLVIVQSRAGGIGFEGAARASGALPGGSTRNLVLPLSGNWSARSGLALWRRCTPLAFDSLVISNLVIERRAITLCPRPNGAIVRTGPRGLAIAAGLPSLDLAGRLGASPIRIASGPIGFAWPGALVARSLDIALGPRDTASRFTVTNLTAQLGRDVSGRFSGSDVLLSAVPLDLRNAEGAWRYAGGRFSIRDASFRLEDREQVDRFEPLQSEGAQLDLFANRISALATLREPASGREVVRTVISHDLGSAVGHANLAVDALTFDNALQPDTLSTLALGIVANAEGTVRGTGRIDWNGDRVTSFGRFSTDDLDFAAEFGPVKGMSGTVVFTDLLGLVTAPDQKLRIASINPGIEATDGELSFALLGDKRLRINGAEWPFLGGTLRLKPAQLKFGSVDERRFILAIRGLDAAQLVNRLEMANISAVGIFDGELPLVFDENGGRIDNGVLVARGPGNISYVGALTYKDLSPMGNFAFEALRSLNYRAMRVEMEGRMAGEIITKLRFDGVTQGEGARRNFITRRIGRLPIRFLINVRAPFFQLMRSFRSLYDPAYVTDPRVLGLVDKDGKPIVQPSASGVAP